MRVTASASCRLKGNCWEKGSSVMFFLEKRTDLKLPATWKLFWKCFFVGYFVDMMVLDESYPSVCPHSYGSREVIFLWTEPLSSLVLLLVIFLLAKEMVFCSGTFFWHSKDDGKNTHTQTLDTTRAKRSANGEEAGKAKNIFTRWKSAVNDRFVARAHATVYGATGGIINFPYPILFHEPGCCHATSSFIQLDIMIYPTIHAAEEETHNNPIR